MPLDRIGLSSIQCPDTRRPPSPQRIRSKSPGFDKVIRDRPLSSLNTKALDVCLLLFYFKKKSGSGFYAQALLKQKDTAIRCYFSCGWRVWLWKSTAIAKRPQSVCLSEPALVTDGPRSDDAFRCECRQASFTVFRVAHPLDTVRGRQNCPRLIS